MSWQDTQEKDKTLNEQFELLQQDIDRHAKYENGILYVTFPKEETKKEAEEKKFVSID